MIFLKKVKNPGEYGVAEIMGRKVIKIAVGVLDEVELGALLTPGLFVGVEVGFGVSLLDEPDLRFQKANLGVPLGQLDPHANIVELIWMELLRFYQDLFPDPDFSKVV